ncbi:MAG: type II secretion system F family protein [Acidimicrobiia bacterium]|nr:type II secretion system F family protein [Acidimicrobiia bacterium]
MSTIARVVVGVALAGLLARAAVAAPARGRARRFRVRTLLLPTGVRARIVRAFMQADIDVTPEAAARWWVLAVASVAWFAMVLAPPLLVPAIVAAVTAGPIGVRMRSGQARRAVRAALPGVLDLIVAQLRAGGTVAEALDTVASRPGPLRADFARVSARCSLGAGLDPALAQWAQERPIPGVRSAAGALAMVTLIGGSAATALEGLSVSLRNDDAALGEAKALSAQARVSAIVVGGAPLAYLIFAAATDPGSTDVLVSTTAGRICLVLGLGLEGLAAVWMRALLGQSR